ncbi:DUF2877 domain-containing protein [Enterococcus olivae]
MNKIRISEGIFPIHRFGRMGKIHSVFDQSFNIEIGERLLNVGTYKEYLASFGLSLSHSAFEQLKPYLQQENLVRLAENSLAVYSAAGVQKIDWQEVEIQRLQIKDFHLTQSQQQRLRNLLEEENLEVAVGLSLTEAKSYLQQLKQKELSLEKWRKILAYFIGRGQGLTPAGDDLVVAYLVMLQILRPEQARQLISVISLAELSTTDISKEYLYYSLKGYGHSLLYQLLVDVQMEKEEQVLRQGIQKIRKIGHSSGNDLCYGLLVALWSSCVSS